MASSIDWGSRRIRALAATTLIAALLVSGSLAFTASAERSQKGSVVVTLNGGIRPRSLPRQHRVPVTVHLAGRVDTVDDSALPRVNWIRLELAWRGRLKAAGLAVCPVRRIRNATTRLARRLCGPARVGGGRLFAKVFIPNQAPLDVRARIIAFNGRTDRGAPRILVHAYTPDPPVSFVIPFSVHRRQGSFRTVLIATIRKSVGPWPRVANFKIKVARRFSHRGQTRSYLSASCPVPRGFTAGFLSFARATYMFAGGKRITTESVRSCRASN